MLSTVGLNPKTADWGEWWCHAGAQGVSVARWRGVLGCSEGERAGYVSPCGRRDGRGAWPESQRARCGRTPTVRSVNLEGIDGLGQPVETVRNAKCSNSFTIMAIHELEAASRRLILRRSRTMRPVMLKKWKRRRLTLAVR